MKKNRLDAGCESLRLFGVRRLGARVYLAILGVALCAFIGANAETPLSAKKVLIVFSFSNRGNYDATKTFKSAFRAGIPEPIDFYVEYLEGRRLDDKEYEKELVATLGHRYSHAKLDLVLIQSYIGLEFAATHHDELFPGVPIVFLDVDPGQIAWQKMWPGVTGATAQTHVEETIELALHLHPSATTVAVIEADSEPDKFFLARMHAELLRHQGKVREVDLIGVPTNQLIGKVAALPPQSIVFFQLVPEETRQPAIEPVEVSEWVAQRLPTYSIFPYDVLAHGGVGGVTYDWNQELALAVSAARRGARGASDRRTFR